MPTANSLKVFRSLFQIMYRLYRGVVFIFSTCHTSVVFPYFPLSLFDVITDFLSRTLYVTIVHYPLPHTVLCINEPSQSAPVPFVPHIIKGLHYDGHWHVSGKRTGCRRCFVHAADYRRYGKWSSRICSGCVPPLSGYFARAKKPAGERGSLKTFLWHAIFLQRNLRTLTISVSGWPAISSPCRSDEEPKFFPYPLSLYHWFLFTNWYSTCFICDICPFSLSLQYHNPITGNLDGEQAFRLYISVYRHITNKNKQ